MCVATPDVITSSYLSLLLRFGEPKSSKYLKSTYIAFMPTGSDPLVALDNPIIQGEIISRAPLHREPTPRVSELLLDHSDSVLKGAQVVKHRQRGRRHTNNIGGRGHGHLMRVGCVLGTCQVQNLSHRLYQLIGQSGREDSSPINPRSPHSYG